MVQAVTKPKAAPQPKKRKSIRSKRNQLPKNIITLPEGAVIIDPGNGMTIVKAGNKYVYFPSFKTRLGKNAGLLPNDPRNKSIRMLVGEQEGEVIIMGENARFYPGMIRTYQSSKPQEIREYLLGALSSLPEVVDINAIYVVDSSPELNRHLYEEELIQQHSWQTIVDGKVTQRDVFIESVHMVQEGLGTANLYLAKHNIIKPYVCIINIGLGTLDFVTINRAGQVQNHYRQNIQDGGGINFFSAASSYLRQTMPFNMTPDEFFLCLGRGGDIEMEGQHFNIYGDTQIVARQWLNEQFNLYKQMFQPIYGGIEQFILVGGLANLLVDAYKKHSLISVTPCPGFDNVEGVLLDG